MVIWAASALEGLVVELWFQIASEASVNRGEQFLATIVSAFAMESLKGQKC